jgi:triphosphoribosyl-dephospho-CoA synthase
MRVPSTTSIYTRGEAATLACLLEASAPKPGNVYPGANFDDVTFHDFERSAEIIGPILGRTRQLGVGRTILEAVRATRERVSTNTNLGMLLLLAPLAAVPDSAPFQAGIPSVLAGLSFDDTRLVYEAIRVSAPGGLGTSREADVLRGTPPNLRLVDAMRMAADVDLVARQYTNGFNDVLCGTAELLAEGVARGWRLSDAIVNTQLRRLARHGDSLIVRKCGQPTSDEVRDRAAHVLAAGLPGDDAYECAVAEYDGWLRGDDHRRNPGTTADLIAAGLFVLLREGRIELNSRSRSHYAGEPLARG